MNLPMLAALGGHDPIEAIFRRCVKGSRNRPLYIRPIGHTYTKRSPETEVDRASVAAAQAKRDRKAARNLSLAARQ